MIQSFICRETQSLFESRRVKRFAAFEKQARIKLKLLNAVHDIEDLRSPPGNRLETLIGDRSGQHSIRINKRWRLCFVWQNGDAHEVQIVDYH